MLAAGLSLYALYWTVQIVPAQIYRVSFLLLSLVLTFILYPARSTSSPRVAAADWALVAITVAVLAFPIFDFSEFVRRAATPTTLDIAFGAITTLLVLEATRRTVGWILPVTAGTFLLYGYYGPYFELIGMEIFAHRGYTLARLVGTLYMTLEGIFGVPVGVSASFIILFIIYGAVLEKTGASRFFVDFALAAMGRRPSGAGRTVTLASFLLGGPSGSGVATTVTVCSIAYPMLSIGYVVNAVAAWHLFDEPLGAGRIIGIGIIILGVYVLARS